jgi:flavin-dependent thymidylate synthase
LKVSLAGYNTDVQHGGDTPETISAAYARISRDPRPVGELRAQAATDVSRARASNRRIVFDYGHGSVAEHAFFNFDVLEISRLAAEALQSFRLASFTEKSQRYVKMNEDWILPPELEDTELADPFSQHVRNLFGLYDRAMHVLMENGLEEGRAKEDARYLLPLATTCQMGMSLNARELEHMVRRLSGHPLFEARALSKKLLQEAVKVAPSLLRHLDPTDMDRMSWDHPPAGEAPSDGVELVRADDDGVIGPLLIRSREGGRMDECKKLWQRIGPAEAREVFERVLNLMGPHDLPPREWELARYTFDLSPSASAYAQLKRHRMCTLLISRYQPSAGLTVPPSFVSCSLEEVLREAGRSAGELWKTIGHPGGAYALTNAHRRRVVVEINARELYHFSRLREDVHAQWDIRGLAGRMVALAREAAPLTLMRTGGKSEITGPAG